MTRWYVYILRCSDGSLYTGITTDLNRRLLEHNNKKTAAAYTRARRPVELVYSETSTNRSEACRREYQIKQFSVQQKRELIALDK